MPKVEEKEHYMDLFDKILELKNQEECFRFFHDLCSLKELYALEQRFEVAKMLYQGEVYTSIMKKTNASTATISRVNRVLNYGKNGLMDIFDRTLGNFQAEQNKRGGAQKKKNTETK